VQNALPTISVHGVKIVELVSILKILSIVQHQKLSPMESLVVAPQFMIVPLACMDLEEQVEIVFGVQTAFVTLLVGWLLSPTVAMRFVVKLEEIVQCAPLFLDVLGAKVPKHVWTNKVPPAQC